jgi:hypothetical protein
MTALATTIPTTKNLTTPTTTKPTTAAHLVDADSKRSRFLTVRAGRYMNRSL